MGTFKIAGHCTICDSPCFDIQQVYEAHEKFPGEPKRIGLPNQGAKRITYALMDGTCTDLTFCSGCEPISAQYNDIWAKNLRSWQRELGENRPEWFMKQLENGILYEVGRKNWTELING